MTGVACSAMVDMISFSFSPTSVYTVGISDEIAQLPMFSGFLFRLVLLIIANIIMAIYGLHINGKICCVFMIPETRMDSRVIGFIKSFCSTVDYRTSHFPCTFGALFTNNLPVILYS